MTFLRWCSGVVAAGTVVLAAVVVATAFIAGRRDFPGPGVESVAWHVVIAVTVISAQILADRNRGAAALFGSTVVFVGAGILLWTQWWG